jgi:hypothetical protein
VFGPVGCCVAGTRPHGPGNQGGRVDTCWARCLRARLGGARSPASPSPTHGVQVWHRAWGWMGVDNARVGDCWVVLHTKRPALRMVIKPIPLRTGCATRQYPDLVADHRLCVCTPGAPRRGFAVHLRQVPHLHTGKRPHSEVRGKSQSYWGHSEVVFWAHRVLCDWHQAPWPGECWAHCCVHGWAAHARQHPRAPQGSLLSFARVETVSLAQPSAPRPLSSAGNSNTPTRWGQAAQVLPSRHRVRVATAQLVKLIVLSSNSSRRLNSFKLAGLLNSAFGVLIQSFYLIIDRTPE